MSPRPATTRRCAFTLIELVAVMVVIGAIGAISAMTFQRAAAANAQVSHRGALYAEASSAMDRLIRKLQTSPRRASAPTAVPAIASMTAAAISWDDQSQIAFAASSQTVTLRDVPAGDSVQDSPVLMGNVSDFSFTPIDDANANLFTTLGVAALSAAKGESVRRVEVQFTLTRDGQSVTLRSRAFLRCTMTGMSP